MTKIPVFDIGDTLLPSHERINDTVKQELKEQGVENPPKMPINQYNIYKPDEVREWLIKNGLEADAERIKSAYIEWEEEFLKKNVLPELERITEEFGPIGFVSDNSIQAKKFYKRLFNEEGVAYEGFVVSEEIGVTKPDPAIFKEFLDKRDEEPESFVYFGNYVDRDKAAENVGMHFVWDNQYHVFGSSFNGLTINKLSYSTVKKALKEVEG